MRSIGSSVRPQLSHWSPRIFKSAVRAGTFRIAVRQEALRLQIEHGDLRVLEQVALLSSRRKKSCITR